MPNFRCHIAVSSLTSALAVAYGSACYGWTGSIPTLAFVAGAVGGMVPDLDSNTSRPRRYAGILTGLAAAAGTFAFFTGPGDFWGRPWSFGPAVAAAAVAFLAAGLGLGELLKRRTRHRGLFHSLPVPFLYGGIWACLMASRGASAAMAVWLVAVTGVFTHLILDSLKSLSLRPLKPATNDLAASTQLWVMTAAVTLAAFARVTKF